MRLSSALVRTLTGRPSTRTLLIALTASGSLVLASCATFDDSTSASGDWQPTAELTPERGPQPDLPEVGGEREPDAPERTREPIPPPDGCTDHDPAVIATCLGPVGAVAALPPHGTEIGALAGERESGTVHAAVEGADPREFASLEVDATGDGGLTGLALSPTYHEDRLVYAYISTEEDNRVVRFAEDGDATPVLTGIPKGDSGNAGALGHGGDGTLLVATGDGGDPDAAEDPDSLAGKVLRIDRSGDAAEGNPEPDSPVIAGGLHSPGGLCASQDGTRSWVTDQGGSVDRLYRIEPGEDLSAPAWTWEDRPGVAGCADWSDLLMVTTSNTGSIQSMPIDEDGVITAEPQVSDTRQDGNGYGRIADVDVISKEVAVAGTVNKAGGDPVSSDDRVVLLLRPEAGSGGAD
ncbi:PQQ-dependent sugar dehydrogenase [Haloechinothrix alba]|nr:PQQ-dependent sugar dehydrogenase [Haloechinothrix alba]